MSMIPQTTLFSWENDIENLGDNERLVRVLEHLPDEPLMQKLEKERGRGRNDYPVRAMWNMLIAMIVFGHDRFAGIIREMKRNIQLRYICGFDNGKTPDADNMSRFISKLIKHEDEVNGIFYTLSDMLYGLLPDFGENLAMDSKWVWSLANRKSKRGNPDGRSEADAEWGIKEYSGVDAEGVIISSKKKCFGFKIHLIVDANYELPVAFTCSPANGSDISCGKEFLKEIEKDGGKKHILEKCRHFMADKGYDDETLINQLAGNGVKAVIDKRYMWKSETEKEVPGSNGCRYYDEHGNVYCYSPEMGERHRMIPMGYESERDSQRFKCPASHYGATCKESCTCNLPKTIRVPLETDRRIFTEVGRTTYKWDRLYAARTSVERVNSRLDVSFGFEARRVRGMKKMNLMSALAFSIMNALAVSSIKANEPERMRSLVRAA
jgi:transposase